MKSITHKNNQRAIMYLLIGSILFFITGCIRMDVVSRSDYDAALKQVGSLEQQVSYLEKDNSSLRTELEAEQAKERAEVETKVETVKETVEVEKVVLTDSAVGINCTLNGARSVVVYGDTELNAIANVPEGYRFDYWLIGDKKDTSSPQEATFHATNSVVIEAVTHRERSLTLFNCVFQFTNEQHNGRGDTYTSFVFEDDYVNSLTQEQMKGGSISGYITLSIPKGKKLDYWLVNGIRYYPNVALKGFRIENLTESLVVEAVCRGDEPQSIQMSSGKTEDGQKSYPVSVQNCTFTGGDFHAPCTEGIVPEGTEIIITPAEDGEGYWIGTYALGTAAAPVSGEPITISVEDAVSVTWVSLG